MLGIIVSIIVNVILRTLFNKPLIWIVEINGIFVVWVTFLALGVNTLHERHFTIELMSDKSSKATNKIMAIIKEIVIAITVAALIYFCYLAITNNSRITTSVLKVKVWIAYYLPALIGACHTLYLIISKHFPKKFDRNVHECHIHPTR